MISLRISFYTLAKSFDLRFGTGENGEAFEKETVDTLKTTQISLHVQFQ
jgi:hypothetical protein